MRNCIETIPHLLYIYVRTLFCVNKYIVPFNKAQENYADAYNNFGGGNEKTAKVYNDYDSAKRQYQNASNNNAEIVRRGSALKAYPRKKTMGGINSYQNFHNYLQNTRK